MKQEQKKTKTYYNQCENEADEMVKYLAFIQQGGCDALTGELLQPNFHPHHFIHRKEKYFRWDLRNVFAVSPEVHYYIHNGNEGVFGAEVAKEYPERIQRLLNEKRRVHRFRRSDFEIIYTAIKATFERTFNISYEDFKKLSSLEKYKLAFEILEGKYEK